MWLTTPNGEHFITSVLWVVSEGLWIRNWTTAQKENVCSHEAVGIESANSVGPAQVSGRPYVAAAKVIPLISMHAPKYAHQTLTDRQADRQTT